MKKIYSFLKEEIKITETEGFNLEESNDIILGINFFKLSPAISLLSESLFKLSCLELSTPSKVSIILPNCSFDKYKEEDSETTFQTIVSLTKELKSPKNGVHYTFFRQDKNYELENRSSMEYIWQTDTIWSGQDSNYILLMENKNKNWLNYDYSFLMQEIENLKYDIKKLTYEQTLDHRIDLLKNCKVFLTPSSGHLPLALMINVPTIFVEPEYLNGFLLKDRYVNQIHGVSTIGLVHATKKLEGEYMVQQQIQNVVSVCTKGRNEKFLENYLNSKDKMKFKREYVKENFNLLLNNPKYTVNKEYIGQEKKVQKL